VLFLTDQGKWISPESPLFITLAAKFVNLETAQDAAAHYKGTVSEVNGPAEGRKRDSYAGLDEKMVKRFLKFDREHPSVYASFVRFAQEIIASGKRRISHRAILDRIRWDAEQVVAKPQFKINSQFAGLYVRKLLHEYPQYANKITLRERN
jgi:hypothetical protein